MYSGWMPYPLYEAVSAVGGMYIALLLVLMGVSLLGPRS